MDFDIEMDDASENVQSNFSYDPPQSDEILQPDEPHEPGEVPEDEIAISVGGRENELDENTPVPNKVHIRGVDTLHTNDIQTYVKAHFGPVDKIEWVDDTCANLVFGNEMTARDALVSLSAVEIADAAALVPGEFLPAKPSSERPEVSLQVRFAVKGDKKQAGAAMRSRYYLLHPEFDPEERRRKSQETRSRYRDREGDPRRTGGRRRRRSDDEVETFEASMYDDAPRPSPTWNLSDREGRSASYVTKNSGKELFADRTSRRNRSASPMRGHDGDTQMDDSDRSSSTRNRLHAKSIRSRLVVDNSSKELFPTKASEKGGQLDQLQESIGSAHLRDEDMPKIVTVPVGSSVGSFNIRGTANLKGSEEGGLSIKGAASTNARELFPGKLGSSNAGKELFSSTRTTRRQKAHDLFS